MQALGGDIFFVFISAIAFATILAVVAGLTISASTSFAHDFYTSVEVRVTRVTAFAVGAASIAIAIILGPTFKVAFLVGVAAFPLENPGIVSIPLGFLGAFLGTMSSRPDADAKARFTELEVRANTGLGSEKAVPL